MKSCQKLKKLKVSAEKRGAIGRAPLSAANAVAAEILAVGQAQRVLTRVKNFGYVALAICILNAVCGYFFVTRNVAHAPQGLY